MDHYRFGAGSKRELDGVHSHLVILVTETLLLSPVDFAVFDGIRTLDEQRGNIRRGVSWTLQSRHLTGHAVDLVPYIDGRLTWSETSAFITIGGLMRSAAKRHGIAIKWGALKKYGGDWSIKNDMAHFELDRFYYFTEG